MNDVIIEFWWDPGHLKILKAGRCTIPRTSLSLHLKSNLGALLSCTLKRNIQHLSYIIKFYFLTKNRWQNTPEIASFEMICMVTALYLAINENVPKLT